MTWPRSRWMALGEVWRASEYLPRGLSESLGTFWVVGKGLPMTVPKGKVRKAREEGGSSNECEIWKVNPLGSWKRPGCTEWGYWKYACSLRDSTYSSCTRLSGRGESRRNRGAQKALGFPIPRTLHTFFRSLVPSGQK